MLIPILKVRTPRPREVNFPKVTQGKAKTVTSNSDLRPCPLPHWVVVFSVYTRMHTHTYKHTNTHARIIFLILHLLLGAKEPGKRKQLRFRRLRGQFPY